jgi:hypothetical protein
LAAIRYWITSSAVANSVSGMVRPSALAVLLRDALPSPGYIYVEPFCGSVPFSFNLRPREPFLQI